MNDLVAGRRRISRRRLMVFTPALLTLGISPAAAETRRTDVAAHPSLQAAVDATPDGGTVFSSQPQRELSAATLRSRNNIVLDGLRVQGPITFDRCTGCGVRNSTITGGDDGTAVVVWFSSSCFVQRSEISAAGLVAYSPVRCVFDRNTVRDSPRNAISVTVLDGKPAVDNRYTNNVIRNCGRVGIEEYPHLDASKCTGAVIAGNTIELCQNMGISAPGLDPSIVGNKLRNTGWAGIEVTGAGPTVSTNEISSAVYKGTGIVVYGRPDNVRQAATISGNQISALANGILLHSPDQNSVLQNATISSNVITDCADVGINATAASSNTKVLNNRIVLTQPSLPNRHRVALRTNRGILFAGNRIAYTASSQGQSVDVPIHLVGDDVTLANSVVDGGGRSPATGLNPSSAIQSADYYTGWRYLDNAFVNGATIDKSGTVAIEDTDR